MKNEAAIAVVLGLFFGGLLAFFIISHNQNQSVGNHPVINKPTESLSRQAKVEKENFIDLEIKSPQNEILVHHSKLELVGQAAKNSLVVIQTQRGEEVFLNKKNDFKKMINLGLGENDINVTIYNQKIQTGQQSKSLKVFYFND